MPGTTAAELVLAVEASAERLAALPEARALLAAYVGRYVADDRVGTALASMVERMCALSELGAIEVELARGDDALTLHAQARSRGARFEQRVAIPLIEATEV